MSEALAAEAMILARRGKGEQAALLRRKAAVAEERALAALAGGHETTRGVTAVSAAALFFKGGDFAGTVRIADREAPALSGTFAGSELAWLRTRAAKAMARAARRPAPPKKYSCIVCRQPIEARRFAFGGASACERCVREYYARRAEPEADVEQRLNERAYIAAGGRRGKGEPSEGPGPVKCCACHAAITGDVFGFGGGLGCEGCVRKYLAGRSTPEIGRQLRERRAEARVILQSAGGGEAEE